MKKVLVLMSTYNGEKYINSQINSILNQKGVDINLLVRDDGSKDNTIKILQKYKRMNKNVDFFSGKNLKPAKSFIDLLIKCPKNYDYYAFADQDDFWYPNKILVAINKLFNLNRPSLYCSNSLLVDKNLKSLNRTEYNYIPNFTFPCILVAGEIQGATMVMNNKLVQLFNNIDMPKYIPMHDYFVSLICSGIGGNIIFDPKYYMKYRQHDNNVLGIDNSFMGKIKRNSLRFLKQSTFLDLEKMCNQLLTQKDFKIKSQYLEILRLGSTYRESFVKRIKMVMIKNMNFNKLNQNITFKLALLLGKI